MSEKNPFFKQEDLESIEFLLEGSNVTSGVKITPGSMKLLQILEGGLWVSVPLRSCANGHSLSLTINARKCVGTSKRALPGGGTVDEKDYVENSNQVSGVIEEVDTDSKSFLHVKLVFRQYAIEKWNSLLNQFSEKQGSINNLLKATRK